MKNLNFYVLLLLGAILLTCSSDDPLPQDNDKVADIYIAGIYTQKELNKHWQEAAYWKNGKITLPTTSATEDDPSEANSIFVEGNDS